MNLLILIFIIFIIRAVLLVMIKITNLIKRLIKGNFTGKIELKSRPLHFFIKIVL